MQKGLHHLVRNFNSGREKNVVRNFGATIQILQFQQSVLVFGVSCNRISSPLRNDHDCSSLKKKIVSNISNVSRNCSTYSNLRSFWRSVELQLQPHSVSHSQLMQHHIYIGPVGTSNTTLCSYERQFHTLCYYNILIEIIIIIVKIGGPKYQPHYIQVRQQLDSV